MRRFLSSLMVLSVLACTAPENTSEDLATQSLLPFEYAAQLDTVELGAERVYRVHYTLVGGLRDTTVRYTLQLIAGKVKAHDTLIEFLKTGDTLVGDYLFVEVPVSSGKAAFSSHLETIPPNGQ
ncbi:MAG TPA: hypothetical protein DCL07_01220 [Cryomorphaceae bacterium]|jgi:hypothetical protein|nr:MAG: hypothetical protein ABR98_01190 [Cryomorphaceae bacterium BACL7 MAG-120910-bin2]KRO69099.1 MAG: hypothetical protein ABR88_02290 [Cryomorphaceae bacterium BACL7 MAG-120322-bin74]KRO82888.1 MAG: hypothetical protein ABR87_07255 [Cryomorphaceae bacterium BACL7 MAG-121220-bin83]HAB31927.1 hypothetical protein [Cryomorphaceae bacterium]HAG48557.1 hypothetical protein [Cryomorphaceae bacterium]|tara:strand:- start:783 stop:1154 length:372 start_codon:yes stop_codon:yes gene_type:complete